MSPAMKLTLDEEQQELGAMVRRLLAEQADSEALRKQMDSPDGFDRDLWRTFAKLGLLGLTVPEEFGGAGAGHAYRAVVLTELGRAAVPTPFVASAVLATDALATLGGDAVALLPELVDGTRIASLAIASDEDDWQFSGASTVAAREGDHWLLRGTKTGVLFADASDLLVVLAHDGVAPAWFVVETDKALVTPQETYDPTSRAARVTFANTPAQRLDTDDPEGVARLVRDQATVALAALAVGGHEQVLDTTVDYAKVRMQFGRPIGSYQAIKHGLADLYCRWELGLSLVRYAAWAADEAPGELATAAASGAVYVLPAYFEAARESIQFHGGIGFTWEHDAHLQFKRARSTQLLLGSTARRRRELAALLGH